MSTPAPPRGPSIEELREHIRRLAAIVEQTRSALPPNTARAARALSCIVTKLDEARLWTDEYERALLAIMRDEPT